LLAAKIAAIRTAVGPELFINARCDVWLRGVGAAERRVDEALRRAAIYAAAGADGFFAPGLVEPAGIAALTAGTSLPVNLLAYPGLPGAAELERLGVRRLSAGSGLASAAFGRVAALTRAFLADGNPEPMMEGGLPWSEMNALMP
jgi:2-methylisocitrate lyase-like PEP mutase family enzyme